MCTQMMAKVKLSGFGGNIVCYYTKENIPIWLSISFRPIVSATSYGEYYISNLLLQMMPLDILAPRVRLSPKAAYYISHVNNSNNICGIGGSVGGGMGSMTAYSNPLLRDCDETITVTSELTGYS